MFAVKNKKSRQTNVPDTRSDLRYWFGGFAWAPFVGRILIESPLWTC